MMFKYQIQHLQKEIYELGQAEYEAFEGGRDKHRRRLQHELKTSHKALQDLIRVYLSLDTEYRENELKHWKIYTFIPLSYAKES